MLHDQLVLDEVIAGASDSSSPMGGDGDEARVLSTAEARVWRRRVISALANTFVRRGDWRLALDLLETLGKEVCTPAAACDHDDDGGGGAGDTSAGDPSRDGVTAHHRESVISASRVEVLSRIGRIFLQIGAIKDAELFFRRAEEAVAAGDAGDGQAVGDNARVRPRAAASFSMRHYLQHREFALNGEQNIRALLQSVQKVHVSWRPIFPVTFTHWNLSLSPVEC